MTFAETVQTWQTYYLLIGGAAATLAGLLFIGLSLNLEVLRNGESIRCRAGPPRPSPTSSTCC